MKKNTPLTLKLLNISFAIYRFPARSPIPQQVFEQNYYFIGNTTDELSLVVPQILELNSEHVEKDWQALMVVGPLDFSLTGILANITQILAEEKISVFALSTFDTDFILIKSAKIQQAITALKNKQYQIIKEY